MRTEKEIKERLELLNKAGDSPWASLILQYQINELNWVLTDSEEEKPTCKHDVGAYNSSFIIFP